MFFFAAVHSFAYRLAHLLAVFCLLAAQFAQQFAQSAVFSFPSPNDIAVQHIALAVLVNSKSPRFSDFSHSIQPYLENFGMPYRVMDLAREQLPGDIDRYSAIIIGHAALDPNRIFLDLGEQQSLVNAIHGGVGLINFDNDLSDNKTAPYYSYIQQIFGFRYSKQKSGYNLRFLNPAGHYITERHTPREQMATGWMTTAGMRAPVDGTVLVSLVDGQPFLTVTQADLGRAVQWASYDWIKDPAVGPVSGLDDLLWRSIVWAARKPFVMQAMPPFVTMRVDDVSGPLWWAHTASEEFPLKPWLGIFTRDFSDAEASDLSQLVRAGKATALVHAFTMRDFFYANHLYNKSTGANLPDTLIERNFTQGLEWHTTHQVPPSKFTVGHYYEMSANAFPQLEKWGVAYVGTLMEPGKQYGGAWVQEGPYRQYSSGSSKATRPFYYADYVQVPEHPELSGKFFNCMTEIRDDAGYEWYPGTDVQGSIARGKRQTLRALDSLVLATLFTHEYHILEAGPQKWRAILKGVTGQLASWNPMYVTIDQACQYARAIHDTKITASIYSPKEHLLTATLTGSSDLPTLLYLFTEKNGKIDQKFLNVPVITNTITVTKSLP